MNDLVITKERWEDMVELVEDILVSETGDDNNHFLTIDAVYLIVSVLKNNTPFEVCEDSHVVI